MTAINKLLLYKADCPFDWFLKEVAQTQRETDEHDQNKIAGEISKLKCSSFQEKWSKMLCDTNTRLLQQTEIR